MCKQLLDILHPFNIFGKKIVHRTYELPPIPPIPIPDMDILSIEWEGDRLDISYTTQYWADGRVRAQQHREVILNSETKDITIMRDRRNPVWENTVYFKCTNVTSLIVNGEQLI